MGLLAESGFLLLVGMTKLEVERGAVVVSAFAAAALRWTDGGVCPYTSAMIGKQLGAADGERSLPLVGMTRLFVRRLVGG